MKVRILSTTSIVTSVTMSLLMGCGAVGLPIPPENVGVNPTIERQKELESVEKKQREAATAAEPLEPQPDSLLQGQDVNLPPLQPVGTR